MTRPRRPRRAGRGPTQVSAEAATWSVPLPERPPTSNAAPAGPSPVRDAEGHAGESQEEVRRTLGGRGVTGQPQQSRDDTDEGWGERPAGLDESWWREQRPPHWG